MKGLIDDRQERDRDRQLPRRVRDEPLEGGPRGRDPEPRDRPAGLPARRALVSSVGPIDETQLFYLESRGIPPDEARKFIVLGFLEPVVARVPLADGAGRACGDARGEVGRRASEPASAA